MWLDQEEARIISLERMLNKIQTAINNLAPKEMLRRLLTVRQTEINSLDTRVTALEAAVAILQQD